jgi:hypothetical protein
MELEQQWTRNLLPGTYFSTPRKYVASTVHESYFLQVLALVEAIKIISTCQRGSKGMRG